MMIVMMSMMKLSYLGLNKVLPRVGIYIISLHVDQQGKTIIIEGAIKSLTMSHIAFKHLRLFIGRPRYMCMNKQFRVQRQKFNTNTKSVCLYLGRLNRLSAYLKTSTDCSMLAGIYRV